MRRIETFLHRNPLLALVVLAGAVGVERLVADPSAEDFFDSLFFRHTHFINILRLIIVIIGHGLLGLVGYVPHQFFRATRGETGRVR